VQKKVLLIDDSPLIHKLYPVLLRGFDGYELSFVHALDGQQAFLQLAEHPDTALILLDINMPVMSGLDFLKRLDDENDFSSIPVVVISTRGKEKDIELCMESGASEYLVKPFGAPKIIAVVERALVHTESTDTGITLK